MERPRNSAKTQQSGHVSRYEPEIKNIRRSAKDGVPEAQDVGQSRRRVDPADDVRRRSKQNFPSIL